MDNEFAGLISKRALLERFGISYGALYRWKRKGLIPDDWFIRKATSSGHETFFPEDKILERVQLILDKKENVLLDEISQELNQQAQDTQVLILRTIYGEKQFPLNDIKQILLQSGDRVEDLTEEIKKDQGK